MPMIMPSTKPMHNPFNPISMTSLLLSLFSSYLLSILYEPAKFVPIQNGIYHNK